MIQESNILFRNFPLEETHVHEYSELTPREQEVLHLIGKGKTTKEIAAILNRSTGTIGNHRKAICRKLDTHSTAELVSRAAVVAQKDHISTRGS